jgi:hypothetical protein
MDEKPLKFNDIKPKAKFGTIEYSTEWFNAQPPETQKELILQGLGPQLREGDGNYTFEVNPDHQAYATSDEPYEDNTGPQEQRSYTEDDVQEIIRRIVMAMQMSESPDCLFQARCILIAFGIGDPPTETELAKIKGCSRQFVSKKVKRIQQMFNLSPSQFMRSEAACSAYAKAWAKNNKHATIKQKQPKKPSKPLAPIQPLNHIKQSLKRQPDLPNLDKNLFAPPPPHPPVKESIFKRNGPLGR